MLAMRRQLNYTFSVISHPLPKNTTDTYHGKSYYRRIITVMDLVQERCKPIANVLELHLSYTNPSILPLPSTSE